MNKILFPMLVILFGVLLLLKNLFNWNISLFKVFVGLAIVAVGISLLTGGFRWFRDGFGSSRAHTEYKYQGSPAGPNEEVVFSERHFSATGSAKFSFIFASGSVDLTHLPPGQHTITVDTVFARTYVYARPDQNVTVRGSAAFGKMQMPNGDATYFGSMSRSGGSDVTIVANAVFGSVEVFERGSV